MGKFNRGDKFAGKKKFDNDRGFGRSERSDRPAMHRAVCSECHQDCEVPFRPTGDKPVFCSNCFSKKEDSGHDRFERRPSARPSLGDKQMFRAVCDKCHKDCEVPFRPSSDKPIFCSDCFTRGDKRGGNDNVASSDQYKKQFEMLNEKLDTLIKLLSPKTTVKEAVKEEKIVVKKEDKKADKKIKVKKEVAPKKVATKAVKKIEKKKIAKKKK